MYVYTSRTGQNCGVYYIWIEWFLRVPLNGCARIHHRAPKHQTNDCWDEVAAKASGCDCYQYCHVCNGGIGCVVVKASI